MRHHLSEAEYEGLKKWAFRNPEAGRALLQQKACVVPFERGGGREQMGIIYGKLGFPDTHQRISFQEARLDKND